MNFGNLVVFATIFKIFLPINFIKLFKYFFHFHFHFIHFNYFLLIRYHQIFPKII